jgi:hypothetical protein
MSDEFDKIKHSKRIHQKDTVVKNKIKIAKTYGWKHVLANPHKYLKCSLFSCGNPNCIFCMNPRKAFKEKTIQERKFDSKTKADQKNKDDTND